ncbi:hypothetical protein WAB17_02215 [Parerythrobacter aurantius]|uniref:hypothetical protein n=1 Tax=Parerythrobacter aurantius TaxID=3127706 RepID=UPI003252F1C4
MSGSGVRRGEPLVVLALILGGWIAVRAVVWVPPFATARGVEGNRGDDAPNEARFPDDSAIASGHPEPAHPLFIPFRQRQGQPVPGKWNAVPVPSVRPAMAGNSPGSSFLPAATTFALSAGPGPTGDGRAPSLAGGPVPGLAREGPATKRWRIDGWGFWREGSAGGRSPGAGPYSGYGGSQAGVSLRYRLAEGGGHHPFAFARATTALVRDAETDIGAGLGARPIAGVPVTLLAEMRLTDTAGRRIVRPVATVVTELAPLKLSDTMVAEGYVQAGYAGGEFATAFVDGHARVDADVLRVGDADLSVGLGLWGGAQKGAERLDAGPSVSVRLTLGDVPVRISADYRQRLAGDAQPGSGAALTIVGGF